MYALENFFQANNFNFLVFFGSKTYFLPTRALILFSILLKINLLAQFNQKIKNVRSTIGRRLSFEESHGVN